MLSLNGRVRHTDEFDQPSAHSNRLAQINSWPWLCPALLSDRNRIHSCFSVLEPVSRLCYAFLVQASSLPSQVDRDHKFGAR